MELVIADLLLILYGCETWRYILGRGDIPRMHLKDFKEKFLISEKN
jgi:hypothetical protein